MPRPDPKFWGFFEENFAILPPPTAFSIHAPPPFTFPPVSFSFLPTFPSPSPINTRTHAPSRNTRVRIHPHTPTRQEVFVYCLHRFTHLSQSAVHQRIRGEEKQEKAFTPYALCHNHLRHTGEEVKAKNENLLTRAYARGKNGGKIQVAAARPRPSCISKSQQVSSAFSPR